MPIDLIHCQAVRLVLTNLFPLGEAGRGGLPMPHDQPYLQAEKKIEEGCLSQENIQLTITALQTLEGGANVIFS